MPLMTPEAAVKRGHLQISIPVVMIGVVAVLVMGKANWPMAWTDRALLAGLIAWPWWSYAVPRWRDWVEEQGLRPDDVQPLAQQTGLIWPRGFFLERTELRRRNGRRGW